MESLFDKYRVDLKNTLGISNECVDMLAFETDRRDKLTRLDKHPLIFHVLLALVSNILYFFYGLKRKVKVTDEDFVFVSCPDPVFRTKSLGLVAGDLKYSIIYLPNFHVTTALKYHQFFKSQGVNAYFPSIKITHVIKAWIKARQTLRIIKVSIGADKRRRLYRVVMSFAVHDQIAKDFLDKMDSFQGKWLLEHDKFFFIPTVANLHQCGKEITMLQHGIFFRPSSNYFPLFCDRVLCCSEREKRIYIDNGIKEERVVVFGAPLQTLQWEENANNNGNHYNLLVLLTRVNESNAELTRSVLSFIKQNYTSVLVRLRPRSQKNDELFISDILKGMEVSANRTIYDDLNCSDKVVSFSEDANIEVAKMNKPFIYVWNGKTEKPAGMDNCATADNYQNEIRKLMIQSFYSTFSKEQYQEILGETDVNILRNRFVKYIRS